MLAASSPAAAIRAVRALGVDDDRMRGTEDEERERRQGRETWKGEEQIRALFEPSPLNFSDWEEHKLQMEEDVRTRVATHTAGDEEARTNWFESKGDAAEKFSGTEVRVWEEGQPIRFKYSARVPQRNPKHRAKGDRSLPPRKAPTPSSLTLQLRSSSHTAPIPGAAPGASINLVVWVPVPDAPALRFQCPPVTSGHEVVALALRLFSSNCDGRKTENPLRGKKPAAFRLHLAVRRRFSFVNTVHATC
jgi:hypothetical protein